jgi:hypothetical protein
MIQSLEQYFIQHGYLDLPSVGSIRLSKKEAIWQEGVLIAPTETIIFDPIVNKPSKGLYIFIADHMGISSEQAAVKLDQLIHEFNEKTVASLEIGALGILHKQADNYTWKSNFSGAEYYKDVSIQPVDSVKTQFEDVDTNKSNKWMVWAIVLFVVAVSLIFYKQI